MFVYFIILTFNLRVRTENSGGGVVTVRYLRIILVFIYLFSKKLKTINGTTPLHLSNGSETHRVYIPIACVRRRCRRDFCRPVCVSMISLFCRVGVGHGDRPSVAAPRFMDSRHCVLTTAITQRTTSPVFNERRDVNV